MECLPFPAGLMRAGWRETGARPWPFNFCSDTVFTPLSVLLRDAAWEFGFVQPGIGLHDDVRPVTREAVTHCRTATHSHLRQQERLHNGGTISASAIDHLLGQKPVDPAAAAALRTLHDDYRLRLVLASNTLPCESRWPALQKAGIDSLFRAALLSYPRPDSPD